MSNKFITWLDNVPAELKKFFTNPVVEDVAQDGLGIATLVDPALAPLFGGLSSAVSKAEALAAAANVQNGSGAQKLALATADAQAVFQAYEQATGVVLESAQQTAIINSVVALLNTIPSSTLGTTTADGAASAATSVPAAQPATSVPPVSAAVFTPAAPAPAPRSPAAR